MNVHIPTTKEIYMISFLVFKSWKLNADNEWSKPGFSIITRDYLYDKDMASSIFELEEAYNAQCDADEKNAALCERVADELLRMTSQVIKTER